MSYRRLQVPQTVCAVIELADQTVKIIVLQWVDDKALTYYIPSKIFLRQLFNIQPASSFYFKYMHTQVWRSLLKLETVNFAIIR